MLYLLYLRLAEHHHYVPVLNLLKYLTFRTGMSVVTAQIIVVAMGSRFIRWMQAKQGRGQPIRADGIARHITEKAGTPTMGGLMILAGLIDAAQADPVGVGPQFAVVVTARCPHHRPGAAFVMDVEVSGGHRHLLSRIGLHVLGRHVVIGVGAVFTCVAIK